jgi:eukaryotic-like serine/threonine-protein kinase
MPEKLGRYEIVRELGKGAMGVVYEGRDPNIDRRVAIKTARRDILEASGMAEEMMERFLREAKAAGMLNHPSVITIFDAAEENGIAYIAMEYLEGGDLLDALEKRNAFSVEQIADIGATICEALAAAHDHGVVHRDIKPANIMMPDTGPLKVADFGIARVSDSNLTQEGALIGTPHYMSPEQFMGQKVDGRSDLFSTAVILYEMITGEKPFSGEALSTVMHHVVKTKPTMPNELNFAVPIPLSQVVMKALSKPPNERYQDGRAMAVALRESVKPNPNDTLLGLKSVPADGATLVTPPAPQADATVVSQAAPTQAPSDQNATLERVAVDSPTVTAPTVTAAPEEPASPPASSRPPFIILVAGIVLVLAIVIGFALRPGGDTPPLGNDPGKPPTRNGIDTPPAATSNHFQSVVFQIWRARNIDDMLAYENSGRDFKTMKGKVDAVDHAEKIEVWDLSTSPKQLLANKSNHPSGIPIRLNTSPSRIERIVWLDGEYVNVTEDATEPGHIINRNVIFPPKE